MKLSDVRVSLFYDQVDLGYLDLEPRDNVLAEQLNKQINIRFILSKDIESYLPARQ